MREATRESETRALGRAMLDLGPDADAWGADETEETRELRAVVRRFARQAVAPHAERIHRETLLIPESVIHGAAELGLFGMSIPEEFGGAGGSASMTIAATEELSAVSLVAGSLITRPEILARALLVGGTDEQKRRRLPEIASGRKMVAVSVTEPDAGSDVAAIACRAAPATVDGRAGFRIDGAKAWSTFAGRAELIALLARTEPRPDAPYRGLSLFIVEKPPSFDRGFEFDSPGGGRLTGRADATLGYRGMHSFSLAFRDWFVPAEDLIGGERGLGRGFHLQMEGFAAGRLQTGGRGVGLARGALDATIDYVKRRAQFGRPIADFQNTQFEIGAMTVRWAEARALTLRAARAMERNEPNAPHLAAMAKLAASRAAVRITQRAQILHGGWGYAEEFAICRLVADALVLPIFEGVEPVLELKVVGRGLLGGSSWL
jgi:(2S)-methylsuccinyl-CoA dehydrogenase